MSDPSRLSGGCLCGAVSYSVEDAFEYALICHCSQCRRATGAAAKPFAGIARAKLSVTKGVDNLLIYGDPLGSNDQHCRSCGSLLYSVVRDGAYVHVTLGTLAGTPSLRPTAHIWTSSKAEWEVICDDLPQIAEM